MFSGRRRKDGGTPPSWFVLSVCHWHLRSIDGGWLRSFEILFQFFPITTKTEKVLPSHTQYNSSFQSSLMIIHSALYSDKLPEWCHSSFGILLVATRFMPLDARWTKKCLLSRSRGNDLIIMNFDCMYQVYQHLLGKTTNQEAKLIDHVYKKGVSFLNN